MTTEPTTKTITIKNLIGDVKLEVTKSDITTDPKRTRLIVGKIDNSLTHIIPPNIISNIYVSDMNVVLIMKNGTELVFRREKV